jgi:signal transduction histidine kinase
MNITLNTFQPRSLKTRVTLRALGIFVISIWVLSCYASWMLEKDMERLLGEQQLSTASFVAAEVNRELVGRVKSLEKIAENITSDELKNPILLQSNLEQRPILHGLFNGGIAALSQDGTVIADIPLQTGRIGINYMDRDYIATTLKYGKSNISQPVVGKKPLKPLFGICVPVFDTNKKIIGALVGVTNLDEPNFLDEITGGSHIKNGYLNIAEPKSKLIITSSDKNRIMQPYATQEYDGTTIKTNTFGIDVLASVKHIPVAGWFVVVALPTTEVFAPIHNMQLHMLIATILLTIIAGVSIWWTLRRQLSPMITTIKILAVMSKTNWLLPKALPVISKDEIGELIIGFNSLLETLSQREEVIKQSEQKLQSFNEELKKEVEAGVAKQMQIEAEHQKEHDALIQSSKMAELGNMLGAIIHQWKQPLNVMAIGVQDIKFSYRDGELNDKTIDEFTCFMMETINFMSKTADDFRDFHKPSKEKKIFSIMEKVHSVVKLLGKQLKLNSIGLVKLLDFFHNPSLETSYPRWAPRSYRFRPIGIKSLFWGYERSLLGKQLKLNSIGLVIEGDETICTTGFPSELAQVVLNIINNAKDTIIERKIKNAKLFINVVKDDDKAVLSICDNGGGIPEELLPDKLFEAFISTKGEKGTGIGLSLSRMIIEENMQGKLTAKNTADGACFMIELPIAEMKDGARLLDF